MKSRAIIGMVLMTLLASCSDDKPGAEVEKEVGVTYSLSAVANPTEGGSVTPQQGTYKAGTKLSIKATPNADYVFTGWSGSSTSEDNPLSLTISGNINLTANFKLREYPLSLTIEGEGTVKESVVSTRSEYTVGTVVELTAVPDKGWQFKEWLGDLSGTENPANIIINGSKSVKAVFWMDDPGIKYTETSYVSPQQITEWLGLGWNISAQLDGFDEQTGMPSETIWGNKETTQEAFNKVAALGFKSVRIPITWLKKVGSAPDYLIDKEYLDRVAEIVGYAEKAGMAAIINIHHDESNNERLKDLKWLDLQKAMSDDLINEQIKAQISSMWKQIARKFRDKGDFLIFEPFNELVDDWNFNWENPLDGKERTFDYYADWCQVFVDAVRSTGGNNASRWLSIPSLSGQVEQALARLDLPKDYVSNNRFIVAVHNYDPLDFTHNNIGEWGHTARVPDLPDSNPHTSIYAKDEITIMNMFSQLKTKFYDNNIPICLDEFGCKNYNNDRAKQFLIYYYEFVAKAAHDYGMAPFIWDDGHPSEWDESFGIFNHTTGEYIVDIGEQIVEVLNRAVYDNNPSYTLQSVYERAPFYNEEDMKEIEIPDENFKKYLMEKYDRNNDTKLTKEETFRITEINVNTDNIMSLAGIEHFNNLRSLICCGTETWDPDKGPGLLTTLDVSQNKNLEYLKFHNNHISSIDVSHNPKLKYIGGRVNGLTSIDISQNSMLEEIDFGRNLLSSIDLSANKKLKVIYLYDNQISALDVSVMKELIVLNFGKTFISKIDLSNSPKLEQLIFYDCPISNINVSSTPMIKRIEMGGIPTADTDINFSLLTNLCELQMWGRTKPTIDLSGCFKLEKIEITYSGIEMIDVSNCVKLRELNLEGDFQLKEVWLKEGQIIEKIVKEEQVVIIYK